MAKSEVKLDTVLLKQMAKCFKDNNLHSSLTIEFIFNCICFLNPGMSKAKKMAWIGENVPITDFKSKAKFLIVSEKYYDATETFLEKLIQDESGCLLFNGDKITDRIARLDVVLSKIDKNLLLQVGMGITSLVTDLLHLNDDMADYKILISNAEVKVDKLFSIMLANINLIPYEVVAMKQIQPEKLSLFMKSVVTVVYYAKKQLQDEPVLQWNSSLSKSDIKIENIVH